MQSSQVDTGLTSMCLYLTAHVGSQRRGDKVPLWLWIVIRDEMSLPGSKWWRPYKKEFPAH